MKFSMTYWQNVYQATRVDSIPKSLNNYMRTAALFVCITTSNTVVAELQLVDGIAAVVNQEVILISELDNRTQEIQERYSSNTSVLPPIESLRRQILDQLILESVQLQKAKQAGMIAGIDELNNAMDSFAKNSKQDLNTLIADDPERYQRLRRQIENQILVSMIQRREVRQRIQVNQREVDAYLDTKQGRAAQSQEYQFQYLRANTEQEAMTIYNQTLNGQKLISRLQSRDLGFKTKGKLPSIIQNINLNKLEINDIIEPVFANKSYHLFQLIDKQAINARVVEQVIVRHILIKATVLLPAPNAKEFAENLRAQIDQGGDFSQLAREYSDDIASRVQGGELGWKDPANFVTEFTQAVNSLEINELSSVIETPFGWHIIQLLDKRTQDISEQELRNQATQAIFQNRFQQELPRWINELRESAFVEIRL